MSADLSCSLELPADFRPADVLAFHRRDPQMFAERALPDGLHKGLLWAGHPACLSLSFENGQVHAGLSVDGPLADADFDALQALLARLLGLNQPVSAFEAACRAHPQLGPLLAARPGLRVPATATPFEALSWAVIGQQISVSAAVALRRKLIKAAGKIHHGGLACYPDAAAVAALSASELRQAGLSASKAATLLTLSGLIVAGELPLDEWLENLAVDAVRDQLLAVKGVGPWTVNYALLRGFGWVDGSLHGDAAVRRSLQRLLDLPEKISPEAARLWLEAFSPWRALVAAHLWASGGVLAA